MNNARIMSGLLIVDDEEAIRGSLAEFLREKGVVDVVEARNGDEALEILDQRSFPLVITDISMPGTGGLDLLAWINENRSETDVAVITGHAELDYAVQAIKNGAFDYFKKPFRLDEVFSTVEKVFEKQYLQHRSLELQKLKERQIIEERHLKEFMLALARIIDMKSPYTREHSDRTAKIAVLIARENDLSQTEVDLIGLGAQLHDIGKLGVSDCILDKPGPLTSDEYNQMKEHPGRGADLCQHISCLKPVVPTIRWHHENLDGSGYPDGLVGEEIPTEARIVRIADYWDAITSHRSYRKPMPVSNALKVMEGEAAAGKLDSVFCDTLFRCIRDGMLDTVQRPLRAEML